MKQKIYVWHKGKLVEVIKRVVEHQGQWIGPYFCRYKNKRHEIFWNHADLFYSLRLE